jgi:glucosamine--fructose-6-phosphate aminotransferase (isomerizing)
MLEGPHGRLPAVSRDALLLRPADPAAKRIKKLKVVATRSGRAPEMLSEPCVFTSYFLCISEAWLSKAYSLRQRLGTKASSNGYLAAYLGLGPPNCGSEELALSRAAKLKARAAAAKGGARNEREASMCGIIGIIGNALVTPLLVEALKRLEYRGYDSAGVATLINGHIDRRRAEGKLVNLEARLAAEPLAGTIGIGHTRWATHGKPSDAHIRIAGSQCNMKSAHRPTSTHAPRLRRRGGRASGSPQFRNGSASVVVERSMR